MAQSNGIDTQTNLLDRRLDAPRSGASGRMTSGVAAEIAGRAGNIDFRLTLQTQAAPSIETGRGF